MPLALLFQSPPEKTGSIWMERRTKLGKAMTLEPWTAEHMQCTSPSLLEEMKWVQSMLVETREEHGSGDSWCWSTIHPPHWAPT